MILTPITLWKDFDDSLPLNEEFLPEEEREGAVMRGVYFLGRQTDYGRVKIYGRYYTPLGLESFPAVLILFEAGFPCDEKLVMHFIKKGYAVLGVDYSGELGDGRHTIYPRDIDYANYARAGRAMQYVDNTARETSWYEWTGVARYAARWLKERPEVTAAGAVGLRTGGEILWKIAPYAPIDCFISIGAAGWLAYRDIEKFSENGNVIFSEERHRFIAGIDSQSYAPYVKCPVMMLCAINDKKCNYDRVYDTFQQINPEVEKAILYSAHGNGLIGRHSFVNIDLFLDKFLKKHSVFLSKPVSVSVANENGSFKVRAAYDPMGEVAECGIFYTENTATFKARDWTRKLGDVRMMGKNNTFVFPLDVYVGSEKALVYTFVRYSNGFSVTSKIQEVNLGEHHRGCMKSRIFYTSEQGTIGFAAFRRRAGSIADCFSDSDHVDLELLPGYGGIPGVTTRTGIITYRVSEPRFEPSEGASFRFDAWSEKDAVLKVVFYSDVEEETGYTETFFVQGGGKWKSFLADAADFKSDRGASLASFRGTVSVVFQGEGDVLINNLLWL